MSPTPELQETTPDYTSKQIQILAAAITAAQTILAAVTRLKECAGLLAQAGGNFDDDVFTQPSGQFSHLEGYHADVLLQQAAPGIDAFLDTNVAGDSGLPTYRELFQMAASKPFLT